MKPEIKNKHGLSSRDMLLFWMAQACEEVASSKVGRRFIWTKRDREIAVRAIKRCLRGEISQGTKWRF